MLREDRDAAAGAKAGGEGAAVPARPPVTPAPSQPRKSIFDRRSVPPLSLEERAVRTDAIERSLQFGAEPVRDGRGWALEVDFIEANREAVEPWKHDRRDKRFYRRSQQVAKAAGQLIGQPGDRIELATRFARLHRREGSDVEGAVRRGLFDAIWRFDHVYDSYTVPRRYGTHTMKTGRVAAVAEEARRRWQVEGLAPADAFWVRNRRNTGLVLVSPNADPDAPSSEEILGGEDADTVVGDLDQAFEPFLPSDDFDIPTEAYDPSSFYRLEDGADGSVFVFDMQGNSSVPTSRVEVSEVTLDRVFDGIVDVLDTGAKPDDPLVQQIGRLVFELAPGTGHALSAREAYKAFSVAAVAMQDGDWEDALLNGGKGLLDAVGAIPGLGELFRIGKGAVKVANLLLRLSRAAGAKTVVLSMAQKSGRKDKRNTAPSSSGGRGGIPNPGKKLLPPPSHDLLEPVGEGVFGPIFTATGPFSGKAGWKKAVDTLSHYKTGEVPAALHHQDVGFISVVWGAPGTASHDGYGLSKIRRFHPEVGDNLPDLIGSMALVSKSKNRIKLESSTHRAGIRLDWDSTRKRWLLTAFKKDSAASR